MKSLSDIKPQTHPVPAQGALGPVALVGPSAALLPWALPADIEG